MRLVNSNECSMSFMQDILKQAMEDNLSSAAELPYFEGDFWPNVLEESIKELDQEEEEKRRQAEAAAAAAEAAAAGSSVSCIIHISKLMIMGRNIYQLGLMIIIGGIGSEWGWEKERPKESEKVK